ncbi:MAG: universal stress protein [Gammaproteobacteria bacterium]
MTTTRILAATDFSADGNTAVSRAGMLAREVAGELHLLHVLSDSPLRAISRLLPGAAIDAEAHLENAARAAMQELVTSLSAQQVRCAGDLVLSGRIGNRITETAAQINAGLLVLGARGDNPVREFLVGSNTEHVLRKSDRSLLAVRQPATGAYQRVLVATDFSAHAAHALQLAGELAPQATLFLLHVYDAPFEGKLAQAGVSVADIRRYHDEVRREFEHDMQAFVAALPPALQARVQPRFASGYTPGVILEQARSQQCDLVAVGKHGRSPVEEWVLGSVTLHTLRHAHCDVLATDRRSAAS